LTEWLKVKSWGIIHTETVSAPVVATLNSGLLLTSTRSSMPLNIR
jgi:hypothetical protein